VTLKTFFGISKPLSIIFLLTLSTYLQADTIFKIISLQHRMVNDLLPIVTQIAGPDGTVHGMNNELIVRASPDRMAEIEAVIAKLDVARVNRKITVKSNNTTNTQQKRAEATGAVKVGKVTVVNNRRSAPNTGRVEVENNDSRSTQNTQQFITVLDGENAFIKVGQVIPFTQEWVTITRRYVQIERFIDWQEVTIGFAVRPRTIGNAENGLIELDIEPRIMRHNGQGRIELNTLKTTVRARLGDWVDLGQSMQNNDDVSRKILGYASSSNQQNNQLLVKIE
jgi:type II secretory pathway component GspD/PulD (secretin)